MTNTLNIMFDVPSDQVERLARKLCEWDGIADPDSPAHEGEPVYVGYEAYGFLAGPAEGARPAWRFYAEHAFEILSWLRSEAPSPTQDRPAR